MRPGVPPASSAGAVSLPVRSSSAETGSQRVVSSDALEELLPPIVPYVCRDEFHST